MVIKKSIDHLNANRMTYWRHFLFACGHGIRCIKAGVFLIIHGCIPGIFMRTGSTLVRKLNQSFTDHINEKQ